MSHAVEVDEKAYLATSAVWELFDLTDHEVVDDAGKKSKKATCKLCEGVTMAYAGGNEQFVQPPRILAPPHSYESSSERMLYEETSYLGYVC